MDMIGKEQRLNSSGWRRGLLPALAAAGIVLVAAALLVARPPAAAGQS
jgi:hypothetical protein